MRRITGARECSRIERFGTDTEEKRKRKQHGPERQRRNRAAHGQENQKAQQKREVVKGRLEEPLEC